MSDTLSSYEKEKLERQQRGELEEMRFKEEQREGAQNEEEEEEDNDQQEQLEEESGMLADEEEQQNVRSQFQRVREMAKEQAKAEIKKAVKKKAEKMIVKSIVIPIVEAVVAFFATTWWLWLCLFVMIIFIAIVQAYGCEFVSWAPGLLNPLVQHLGFDCST